MHKRLALYFFFFFNDTATTEIYTLSLHDALPIWCSARSGFRRSARRWGRGSKSSSAASRDRKSTRLNSSHSQISYAVFCLKKKKKKEIVHLSSDSLNRLETKSLDTRLMFWCRPVC